MARLVFGMNQSLDGFVDHDRFAPGPTLFGHFVAQAQGQTGSIYGRRMYQIMRYWDDDLAEWDEQERAFARAWRSQQKWVVSSTLTSVGPNATLLDGRPGGRLEASLRAIKAENDGEIEVAGPTLARAVVELGLVDLFRIYVHPVVLGYGTAMFTGGLPPLRLVGHESVGDDVVRLSYVPA